MSNNKYRVGFVKNFPHEDPTFTYFNTAKESVIFMRKMYDEGYQSEWGGLKEGNPNIAVLEKWNEDEQAWLFFEE